ncbi:MAG: hypothetical protein GX038_01010 [Erysipelothrix sp.]|nr:hypothetical protein [Erysipelothrix sp.]
MKKIKNRHNKRIRNLIVALSLTAIILSVSTYAWFVGMRTVNVSPFNVEIATTEDLELSLNGKDWDYTVAINAENYNDAVDTVYEDHTNWWAGRGLIPMSSVGDIDSASSRLMLYEKASLTATPGGYRLMASLVNNGLDGEGNLGSEVNGYVAFDLFIKNYTGTQYIAEYNESDEEAIYLSTNSQVGVAESGGVDGTGIENSVRVAFAQIGRVTADLTTETEDVAKITGISCSTDTDVTGICTRTSTIWEPNDTKHVKGAIDWYTTSCVGRTDADLTLSGSYTGACGEFKNGTAYSTYAVAKAIASSDRVDVYDGTAYNGYTDTVGEDKFLYDFPYFTDTHKMLTGTERPTFFTLAPNSITKVRVYIYIEGQDVDNYDFASIGKNISVNFGFTKQRFVGNDIEYDGPSLPTTTQPTTTPTSTTEQP